MSSDSLLFIAVFLASAVEGVEAVTIVLAAGLTRGWRSALVGAGVASVALAAIVAVLGPALTALPIDILRLVVGALLLIFGLQWLRKAILRASGFKALHDEDAIFAAELAADRAIGREPRGIDGYGFTVSFKGVLLEGLEVAFIVVTFGSNQHNIPLAVLAALAAALLVDRRRSRRAGAVEPSAGEHPQVRRRRDAHRVWDLLGSRGSRGALARRRCGDPRLDRVHARHLSPPWCGDASAPCPTSRLVRHIPADTPMSRLRTLAAFLYDFVVGDDPLIAAVVLVMLALTAAIAGAGVPAWWILPLGVVAVLSISLYRSTRA